MLFEIFSDPSAKRIRRQFFCIRQAGDILPGDLLKAGSVIQIFGQTDAVKKRKSGYARSGH